MLRYSPWVSHGEIAAIRHASRAHDRSPEDSSWVPGRWLEVRFWLHRPQRSTQNGMDGTACHEFRPCKNPGL